MHNCFNPTENFYPENDDFISSTFSHSSAWWRAVLEAKANATTYISLYTFIDQPRRKKEKMLHTFRHNQLILIAWKLLFIYGIKHKELVEWKKGRRKEISFDSRVMNFSVVFFSGREKRYLPLPRTRKCRPTKRWRRSEKIDFPPSNQLAGRLISFLLSIGVRIVFLDYFSFLIYFFFHHILMHERARCLT